MCSSGNLEIPTLMLSFFFSVSLATNRWQCVQKKFFYTFGKKSKRKDGFLK
jgi:hypothetical protein